MMENEIEYTDYKCSFLYSQNSARNFNGHGSRFGSSLEWIPGLSLTKLFSSVTHAPHK